MKLQITSELAAIIKTMRTQSRVSSKNLAAHIGKSASYISKLESGEVRHIQEEDLSEILDYIVEGEDFFVDKLPAIIKAFSTFFDPDAITQQLWLLHYDIVKRPVTLTTQLIDDMNACMRKLDMDAAGLTTWINANKDSAMTASFPANQVIGYDFQETRVYLIRMELSERELTELLEKKNLTTNYLTIHSIVFSLLRLEAYGTESFDDPDGLVILEKVRTFLNANGICSLTRFAQSRPDVIGRGDGQRAQTSATRVKSSFVSLVRSANEESIDQIIECFRQASQHDAVYTAQVLDTFRDNLQWDTAFMQKLVGQDFCGLGQMSFSVKKRLLDEIIKLIEKYSRLPEYAKKMETY